MVVKLGRVVCMSLALAGCASRSAAPAPAVPPPPTLADLQREVRQLASDAKHECEQMCVAQVLGQCVLLAVEPHEFVSEECVGDKSRACLLNCTP